MSDTMRVPLVGGKSALIDAADAELVTAYRWYCLPTPTGRFYATAQPGGGLILMHRLILGTPDGLVTDHVNNDGLDNRRSNLRIATWTQNAVNKPKQLTYRRRPAPTSQFKGVSWDKARKKWAASAKLDGRYTYLGRYESEEEAARAYDVAARATWGEFAVLNLPDRVDEPTPYTPGWKRAQWPDNCPQGHPYTPENTHRNGHGHRRCVICKKEQQRAAWHRRQQRLKEAAA